MKTSGIGIGTFDGHGSASATVTASFHGVLSTFPWAGTRTGKLFGRSAEHTPRPITISHAVREVRTCEPGAIVDRKYVR